ncbi:hypothetical protein LINGRAHAP2_LOCUS34351 [Linum grandiflorum]
MEEYYSYSSAKIKLIMAIPMLLLLIFTFSAVTVAGQSSCGSTEPAAVGPCKDDYANCVTNVITVLRDRTAYTEHKTFKTAYPLNAPSGGVVGRAVCVDGSSFADCQSSLSAAKDWLDQHCGASSAGAAYSDKICSMGYGQLSY